MRSERWWYRYSPPFGWMNYYGYAKKPWEYPHDLWLQLKWFYQRGKRGYADNSIWSIDWYLCGFMGDALRDLAKQVHGVPAQCIGRHVCSENPNDCEFFSIDEWQYTIRYIAETFDLGRKIQDCDIPANEMDAAIKRFHHGMDMFKEYFFNLWD